MAETITNLKVRFGADTQKFRADMESGKAAVDGFANQAGDSFNRFASVFGINLGEINAAMGVAKKQAAALGAGLKGAAAGSNFFSKALKILKLALISTGVGAIVVAFGSLVSYFTKTQRGADKVSKVMASMGAIFNVLIDRASSFGEGLFKIFTGNFKEGWDALKGSIQGVGTEIKTEAAAAWELESALQALEEREIALITVQEERRQKIEELRLAAKDETKSAEERRKAISDAIALEKQTLSDEIELQKERVRILQEQTDLGESTRDDYRQLAEEQAKLSSLQSESAKKLRTLQGEYNTLTKEIEANSEAIMKNRLTESGGMSELSPTSGVSPIDTSLETDKLNEFVNANTAAANSIQQTWSELSIGINEALLDVAVGFGEALGGIMNGTAGFKDIGAAVLSSLANTAINAGKIIAAAGIAFFKLGESFRLALTTPGAALAAVAAGVALIAIGSAVKGSLGNVASGGGSGGTYSSNSTVYDSSSSSSSLRGSSSASSSAQTINLIVSGDFKLKGKDLVAAVSNEQRVSRIRS